MNSFFEESMFAGVTLSIIAYLIGAILKKKFKLGIFNPLLIAIVVSIVFLAVGNIDYEVYNEGAKFLSWLLTPATVCLAIPLYEQFLAECERLGFPPQHGEFGAYMQVASENDGPVTLIVDTDDLK